MGLSVDYLKSRFFQGISLEDKDGKPFPQQNFERALRESEAWFTRTHGVLFEPTQVILGNVPAENIAAVPVKQRRSHGLDFEPDAFEGDRWSALKLPFGPIHDIRYVGLGLGGQALPAVMSFPEDWWQLSQRRYFLRLYPGYKSLQAANFSSFHMAIVAGRRRIPNAWRIVYEAGFEDVALSEPDLAHAVAARAVISVLPSIAMLQNGSVSSESVSVDGLSQSRSFPTSAQSHQLSPLQSALETQLEQFLSVYFDTRSGPRVFFL